MTASPRGYSDQMARRIRCLQIASFDCLIRGDVFSEEEAQAILPYLEIRCSVEGFCIVCARARFANEAVHWLHEDDSSPAESAASVLRIRAGTRGFVYHRHRENDVVLLWMSDRERGHDDVRDICDAAAHELKSRHGIVLSYAVGGWRTDLTCAHESLVEAYARLERDDAELVDELNEVCCERSDLCGNEPVRGIQRFVLERFRDPNLSLSTIASRFRLTETYLSQLFKEQTGMNYSAFLEQIRVEEARRLLERNELSISEVGSRVGYQINSTFFRAFRRMCGVSPSTFRKQIRGRTPATHRSTGHAVAV